ncbi:MATE family efflux transporter [Corynebacterium timonense]|uniref:Putative efflux protein, MATE family n=1 Tax=Corynebacterium timonense TaxID=441500 RepID=A0A1H1N3X7_9CORY|nr:MATE family efflux transporter [Corynebacterium timonense]SDR93821.1 putative efflux protein, MATE family [Corynebacterium timonense]
MNSDVSARRILALALPALGVLAANPLYLQLDTAVVGRLGTDELAALAAGAAVQSIVTTQLTFLSYGTTARAARLYGSGNRAAAVAEGVQASWVASVVGVVLAVLVVALARPLALFLTNDAATAAQAVPWMRVAAVGIPLTLLIMAGNGWLRAVQNTRVPLVLTLCGVVPGAVLLPLLVARYGLVGSAVANVVGVGITASLFLAALVREHDGPWGPRWTVIRSQLVLGRDLILRSLSFQVSLLAAAVVAARVSVATLAAHQVLLQLWNFLTLVLDSLAIAAQALTGAALGEGRVERAREVGARCIAYSLLFACALAGVFALFGGPIRGIFTQDGAVLGELVVPWWLLIAMIIVGGVVFALDGVLLGAGDAAFLRTLTMSAVLLGALPLIGLSSVTGWGLVGIWVGQLAAILIRLAGVVQRFRSMKWARTGAA